MKGPALAVPEKLLKNFAQLLSESMGLHFPKDRWGDLEKKMRPVIQVFGFKDDMAGCLQWLLKTALNKEQITILAYHLTIGETYFFRDKSLFELLEKKILPDILNRHQEDRTLRFWSAGCCTGEEPYSLAMLLHNMLPDIQNWKIEILGSDINHEFLRKAKEAYYKKWSFRAIPEDLIPRFFVKQANETFQVIPQIRKMVRFFELNFVQDSYPNNAQGIYDIDLLLCQNVLIYFSKTQIKKTIHQLSKCLTEKGWLSVAPVEAPYVGDAVLHSHHFFGYTLFQKGQKQATTAVPEIHKIPISSPLNTPKRQVKEGEILLKVVLPAFLNPEKPILEMRFSSSEEKEKKPPAPIVAHQAALQVDLKTLFEQKAYAQVIQIITAKLEEQDLKNLLPDVKLLIRSYIAQKDFSSAEEWCKQALKYETLDLELYCFLATIQQNKGEVDAAIKSLKKASFLEPDFIAAHYFLGMLNREKGLVDDAKREFRTVLNLIHDHPDEEQITGLEDFSVGQLNELLKRFT